MATVQRFEDLLAWQKARVLTREIYKSLRVCRDYGFTDQIQRASISVMSNIAEGFESGTRDSFVNYLYIAKGSCGEVRAQLYAAYDIGYLNIQIFEDLKKEGGGVLAAHQLIHQSRQVLPTSRPAAKRRKIRRGARRR
jgi:four helix bundle protein